MGMNLRYKGIEVVRILKEWEVCSLGDLVMKVGSGITPRGGEKVYKKEGRLFLRSQNVGWGHLLLDDITFIDEETHSSFSGTEIKQDDVFLNITGASIGRSAVADNRLLGGNVNQHVCIIRVDASRLNSYYLNFFLLSEIGQKQIESFQAGGNRQGLNFGQIKSFQISLPPSTEQRAVATALRDVDALITSLDRLISKKRDIKQATMQQLLTGKTRLPGFSENWEVKKLKNECELITKGTTPTSLGKTFSTHGVNFIKIESLTDDGYVIWDKLAFIDEETHNLLRRSQLKNKDILFSIAGALGRITLVKHNILPANTNQALALIRLKDQSCLDYVFLTKYLSGPEIIRHIGSINVQAAQANLSLEDIKNFEIRVPTIAEQTAIAAILSDMDAEIAALEQRRDKTRAIKQGMMQELLTGKTRLL